MRPQRQQHPPPSAATTATPNVVHEADEEAAAAPLLPPTSPPPHSTTHLPPPSTDASLRVAFGLVLLGVCLAAFVVQSEVTAHLQHQLSFEQPYFLLWFAHSFYALAIPLQYAMHRLTCRSSTISYRDMVRQHAQRLKVYASVDDGILESSPSLYKRAVVLTVLFTLPSYMWYVAVNGTTMSDLTAVYNTSSFFAYVFSVLLRVGGERFELRRISAVLMSLIGVTLVSLVTPAAINPPQPPLPGSPGSGIPERIPQHPEQHFRWGNLVGAIAAMLYGFYEAVYKKYAVPAVPSMWFANHFTGLMGLVTLFLGWIPLLLLHFTERELFRLPDLYQWVYMTIIAVMGFLFNACFMQVIAFTSPVVASVGLMLTIPAVIISDLLLGNIASITWNMAVGAVMIFVGFVVLIRR